MAKQKIPWNKGRKGCYKLSEETKKKIGLASRGHVVTEETRKKIGEAQKGEKNHFYGKHLSEEHKLKLSLNSSKYWKGKKFSEEHRENLKKNHVGNKGRKLSDKHKNKISESHMGELNPMYGKPHTEDHKKKISDAMKQIYIEGRIINPMKGKHHTQETKEKLRVHSLGRKHTEEFKLKMSQRMTGEKSPMFGKYGKLHHNYGKHHTQETKEKLRLSKLGKPIHSEEHRLKMKEKMTGNNNPMKKENTKKRFSMSIQGITQENDWEGFISFEPYGLEFNNQFRNKIRQRDNQICINCGIHREKLKRALHVHHVNYDKLLTIPENCISLCANCHALTNTNREYWTKLFQEKLPKLYGYKYDEKGNVILELEKLETKQ